MATRDTDFVRLNFGAGRPDIPLVDLGLEWPPPEKLYLGKGGEIREAQEGDEDTFIMVRTSMSALPDEVDHPNLARGATYHYEKQLDQW